MWVTEDDTPRPGLPVPPDDPLAPLYQPLLAARQRAVPFAVAHLAQSLDGRIATQNGVSRWLSGEEDLCHTHRMRALADAVLVGAETVLHDNPQLTVRHCRGRNPVRVVLDPERRLDGTQHMFHDDAAPTLLLAAADRAAPGERIGHAEVVPVPRGACGRLDPHEVRRRLARRGLPWLFIEGGGVTVSRFLAAGALDRLQLTIAAVIVGSGRPGIALDVVADLGHCLRPRTQSYRLGADVLIDCELK